MIFIYYGPDSYTIKEAIAELREGVGSPDLQDPNITVLSAQEVTPDLLTNACATVPFLAERRLVIVEGLLSATERGGAARRGRRPDTQGANDQGAQPGQWSTLSDSLSNMPPTNDVVFVDGALRRDNRLLADLAKIAQVREFPAPTGPALERWISQRVDQGGATIAPAATRLLADLIGPDLWTQSNEIEKLALYRHGHEIQPGDVETMVTPAREASVFAAVDAVLERRSQPALQLITRLLDTSGTVSYVISMLARQVRLVLLAQEMLLRRLPQAEIGTRLGLTSSFPLRKTLDQARRSTPQSMRLLHQMLLESDIAIKTGELEERLALEVLVARFCHSGTPDNRRARAG